MKKLLTVLLTILLVLSMAACSSKKEEPAPSGNEPAATEPEPAPVPEPVAKEFSRGSWNEERTVFTNPFSGIRIELSGNYSAVSESDLSSQFLNDPDFDYSTADFSSMTTIPECMFIDSSTGANANVQFENLKAENAPGITEEQYLDICFEALKSRLEGGNIGDYYTLKLSGLDFLACDVDYDSGSIHVYQRLAVRKVDVYMVVIVFTDVKGGAENDVMAGFFK